MKVLMKKYARPRTGISSANGPRQPPRKTVTNMKEAMKKMNAAAGATTIYQGCCASTMSTRLMEPDSITGTRAESTNGTSYEINCAMARRAPTRAYLLFEPQPASRMPSSPRPPMAIRNRMPTEMLTPKKVLEKGVTAHIINTAETERTGARL